ncbi:MAG: F0F1 ATP synthase subunit A [Patescibacteria group bacterium]
MAADGLHIELSAEPIALLGDFVITNSMFTNLVVSGLLVGFAFAVNRSLTNTDKPTGLQNFAEGVVEALYNFVYSVTGSAKRAQIFLPLISTFFLFILLSNWLGLLPGVGTIVVPDPHAITELGATAEAKIPLFRPGTADLNTTLALGIISIFSVQAFGFHFQNFAYFKKFFNFSSPIMFFVGILELISEFAKIISFAFRLFGNIFAGEVLLVVLTALTFVIAPIPFYGLEVFIGFIQALVFSMLSLVFFNMAAESHDEH